MRRYGKEPPPTKINAVPNSDANIKHRSYTITNAPASALLSHIINIANKAAGIGKFWEKTQYVAVS